MSQGRDRPVAYSHQSRCHLPTGQAPDPPATQVLDSFRVHGRFTRGVGGAPEKQSTWKTTKHVPMETRHLEGSSKGAGQWTKADKRTLCLDMPAPQGRLGPAMGEHGGPPTAEGVRILAVLLLCGSLPTGLEAQWTMAHFLSPITKVHQYKGESELGSKIWDKMVATGFPWKPIHGGKKDSSIAPDTPPVPPPAPAQGQAGREHPPTSLTAKEQV